MPISSHVENHEIAYPMFQRLVWLCSYEKYTNVTKLNRVKGIKAAVYIYATNDVYTALLVNIETHIQLRF